MLVTPKFRVRCSPGGGALPICLLIFFLLAMPCGGNFSRKEGSCKQTLPTVPKYCETPPLLRPSLKKAGMWERVPLFSRPWGIRRGVQATQGPQL